MKKQDLLNLASCLQMLLSVKVEEIEKIVKSGGSVKLLERR